MNKVILIGRLTRDPELRYTSSNVPCCTFNLAVNRKFTNPDGEREADFINIVVWKNMAENCSKYLTKGSQVAIEGRIQVRTYDAQDGSKKYVTEVIAENVQFLDSKKTEQVGMQASEQVTTQDNTSQPKSDPYEEFGKNVSIDDYPSIDEDSLPF